MLTLSAAGVAQAQTIAFVQQNSATPQSSVTTAATTYASAQTAGNLNVVVVGWNDASALVQSVVDSRGNTYQRAVGPTVRAGLATQSIYYAANIVAAAANGNTVTVTFAPAAQYPDIRIAEYRGLATVNPVDITAAAQGNGTLSDSSAVTTTYPNDLLVGANTVQTHATGPGTSYTQRVITNPDGDILEDRIVTTTGSYSATAPQTSGWWVMQMVAFRAAAADATPPTAPGAPVLSLVSSSQINLTWPVATDNVGVTGYLVERCAGAGCSSFAQVGTPASNSFNDTGLAGSTSYTYRVRAKDAAGNLGPYSSTTTATTPAPPDTQAPTAPGTPVLNVVSTTQINLTWTASTDNVGVTGYLVERCNGTGCSSFAQIATPATNSFNDTGLSPSTSYSYRVRATDAASNLGAYSATASATTLSVPDTQPPTAPGTPVLTAVSSTQINVTWAAATDNVGVTGYFVERCAGASCSSFAQVASPAATSFNDTGLSGATSYSYRVRANDAANNLGPYSLSASATTASFPSSLVAAYSFSEGQGTTVADQTGNGHTGSIVNATWTTSGKYGQALQFNGTNAKVSIPDVADLHLTNAMTLEAWVNPSAVTSTWRDVIEKGHDDYFLMATSTQSSKPAAGGTFGGANMNLVGTSALALNTWTHLATTYNGATEVLYVNGTQVASIARTGALATSTNALEIGGDASFGQYFQGLIDEIRVYNVALSASQIAADMASPLGSSGSGPDLIVSSTHAGAFILGQSGATYTLTVTNAGSGLTSATATVADAVPAALTATAVNGTGWSCTTAPVSCSRSDALNPGSSYPAITLTVNVAANAPATVTNSATVSGGGDTYVGNNTATDATAVTPSGSGLVAAYAFDEGVGTTTADLSGNGNTGSIANGTWTAAGRFGNALQFNGTSTWVSIADTPLLDLTTALTLEVWVNPSSLPAPNCSTPHCSWMDVIHKDSDRYYIEASSNNSQEPEAGGIFADAKHIVFAPSALALNTWTHLALTYDSAFIRFYVNGSLVASAAVTTPFTTSTNPLFIGGDPTQGQFFSGLIDEVRIYNTALSSAQIQVDMNTAIPTTPPPLVPDLTIANTHASPFNPGQIGATYSLTVTNSGTGPTVGTVTLSDALPVDLTATAITGAGWTCTVSPPSCTRGDALGAGASYPVVTLTVNVSATAPAFVTSTATVSGGGETTTTNDTASDVTTIGPVPSPPAFVTEAHFAVDQTTTGLNRATLSLNVSGSNTFLIAALHVEFDGGDTNWVATDNGITGTLLLKTDGYVGGSGNQRFQIFYWINPPAGTNDIVIQNTFSGPNEITASAVLLQNVNQTAPLGATALDISPTGRTSESENVTSTASDLVLHVIADGTFVRGTLGPGETSLSVANDGLQKLNAGDGDASLWLSGKPGGIPGTTVSSSGWPSGPSPSPRPVNAVALVLHSAGADLQAPTAPSSLVAASSGGQVNLSWTASSDNVAVTGYFVERCQGTGCSGFAQLGATATAAFTDTAVTVGLSYAYRVRAIDAAGNLSPYSNTSSVTVTDTQPPSAPASLAASSTTSSQIALVWSASTDSVGVAGYRVFRNGSQVGTTSQTSYVDTGLAAGTTYNYVVVAFDAAGNTSQPSNTATVSTVSLLPATPTLVQHVAGGMDNNFATTLTMNLPHPSGAGNALILGIRFNAAGSISGVGDNLGNAWFAGPTVANVSGSIGTRVALFYALNVAPGTQTITVAFGGLDGPGGNKAFPQAVVSEFCNVAAVAAVHGQIGNASSTTSGTMTTPAGGDLIYEWGVVVSNIDAANGAQFNGSSITAGNGFTLLSADLQTGSADQYMVQAAPGAVTPTFSPSGSETWASLAMALKAASGGTPAPAGVRIVHVQHTMVSWPGHPTPVALAFPSTGNLLVGSFTGDTPSLTSVTDGGNNTWVSAGVVLDGSATSAQVVYVPSAVTSPSLNAISVNLTAPCSSTGCALVLYDIAGATASPFDTSSWATGTQAAPGIVSMTSLTPSVANELILSAGAISAHTINSANGTGVVLDSQLNALDDHGAGGTTASRLDLDNAFAHVTTSTVAPVTFSFGATTQTSGGVGSWSAVTAAFYGVAPPLDTTAPSVPSNLSGVGVSPSQINLTWTPSIDDVGVVGYRVYRNGALIGTSAASGFADPSLSGQTSYTYAVSAFDAAGNVSALTAPATASTTFGDLTAPSVPANLQSSNVTSTSLTLTWNNSTDDTGVAGYRVFRNGVLLVTTSATSFADSGLLASTTYGYSVSAFDAAGNVSAQSSPLNVTTAAAPPITFVKLKETRSTAATSSISTGAFTSPVSSGNLIAVWVWYGGSTQSVASVTDTAGNIYTAAVGPTTGAGAMSGFRQEIWYAKNVVGGSNLNVTATFTGAISSEKSITAHEYSGLDPVAPIDGTAAATTTTANASTGAVATRFARELVFGAGLFQGSGSAGTGFTRRSSIASNVSEDKVVSSTGSYTATFTNTAQAAILQVVTFKGAGQ